MDPNCGRRFRSKYHPDEASRLKAEAHGALRNRVNVFVFLMENSWFDNVSLDIEQTPAIIKVLDAGEAPAIIVSKEYKQSSTVAWTTKPIACLQLW